jgi:hypothetical protein
VLATAAQRAHAAAIGVEMAALAALGWHPELGPDPALAPDPVLPPDPRDGWIPVAPDQPWVPDELDPWGHDGVAGPAQVAEPVAVRDPMGILEVHGAFPPSGFLDATEPGPELAAHTADVDLATCSDAQVVELGAAAARLASWAASVELAAIAQLTQRVSGWRGVGPDPVREVSPELMAETEIAAALDLSPAAAADRVRLAAALRRLPVTRRALAAGRIDLPKARAVADAVRPLGDRAAAEVEASVLSRTGGRTRAWLVSALRRAVLRIDPDAARRRHKLAVADRSTQVYPLPDGMAGLEYVDSAEKVYAVYDWLTAEAARTDSSQDRAAGDDRTLDQRRADVLGDIADHALAYGDLPTRQRRRPQIQVTVSLATLLGLDEAPGELAGYGPIPAHLARRIAADGVWRRLLTDPRTGRFDELSVDTYEPPADMRDHVVARDRTCRGPGCRMAADRCDLDHRVPHPRGPTSAENLVPGCRPWHKVKTHTDTLVEPDGQGGLRITLPSGRTYHRPADPVGTAEPEIPPF